MYGAHCSERKDPTPLHCNQLALTSFGVWVGVILTLLNQNDSLSDSKLNFFVYVLIIFSHFMLSFTLKEMLLNL